MFKEAKYTAEIRENQSPNTHVVTVEAAGAGVLLFSLLETNVPFRIDEKNGRIYSTASLDFETQQYFEIHVIARDPSGNQNIVDVRISLVNEFDNTPVFLASLFEAAVASSASIGQSVLQIFASDADIDDFVEYSLGSSKIDDIGDYFNVDRQTGVLTVRTSLVPLADRGDEISFLVTATDQGNPPNRADVPVNVSILPAHLPMIRFSQFVYTFEAPEDLSLNDIVGTVEVDFTMAYKLAILASPNAVENPASNFAISSPRGEITIIEELDREISSSHKFMIKAWAADDPRIASLAMVEISVLDRPDMAPAFTESKYSPIEVKENAPIGSRIFLIKAVDFDQNDAVGYEIDASFQEFKIDPETGWITLSSSLDREKQAEYSFSVIAKSKKSGALAAEKVFVVVTDENDQKPMFLKELYSVEISESAAPGTVVTIVQAVDRDLPPNNITEYFIVGGNELGHFSIRPPTGEIFVSQAGKLDFEIVREYLLIVLASDGLHSSKARVEIQILNANDHRPKCEHDSVVVKILESTPVPSELFTMIADDADADESELKYSLIPENLQEFEMSSTGMEMN